MFYICSVAGNRDRLIDIVNGPGEAKISKNHLQGRRWCGDARIHLSSF